MQSRRSALVDSLTGPVDLGEDEVVIGCSIGVAYAGARCSLGRRAAPASRRCDVHGEGQRAQSSRVVRRRLIYDGRRYRRRMTPDGGFVPPPYPHDRLDRLRAIADCCPRRDGRLLGRHPRRSDARGCRACPRRTPRRERPATRRRSARPGTARPPSTGSNAGSRLHGHAGRRWSRASAPRSWSRRCRRLLSLRDPSRDTVLYPSVAYPTYEMGALLAGLRAVPVPVDDDWHRRSQPRRARRRRPRARALGSTSPATRPASSATSRATARPRSSGPAPRGIVVASDECYAEFTYDAAGAAAPPATALAAGSDGVLAVHSLSKRSNMAGLRAGFVAGDRRARQLSR